MPTVQQADYDSILQLLLQNGFTKNEGEIYFAILKLKKANAIQVSEYVKADKTTVYRAIEKLSKLGLIASTGGKYNNLLFVKDIHKLQSHFEKKKFELDQGMELLNTFIEHYPINANMDYLRSKMTLLEGQDAVKEIYDMRHEKANTLIREITSDNVFSGVGLNGKASWDNSEYWDKIINQRKNSGCYLHQLVDISDQSTHYHRTNKEQFKEVRRVPSDFIVTAGMNIFGNKVAIYNTKSVDIIGIIIEDATIAGLCTNLFDFVWKRSEII